METVTGTMMMIVVTLSRTIETRLVTNPRYTMRSHGLPRASLAALIARYWKKPVSLNVPTTIIIPKSREMVLKSIASTAWWTS